MIDFAASRTERVLGEVIDEKLDIYVLPYQGIVIIV